MQSIVKIESATRYVIWLIALSLLALGGLGAILLTEAAQMINLPRSWVFWYFDNKNLISVILVLSTAAL